MTNRMEAEPDALTREMFSRRVPSRNGKHQGNGKPKTSTRFAPLNNVVDHHLAEMTPAEVKVFMVLFRHIDKRSGTVTRSGSQLAIDCGLDRRSIVRAISKLSERGLLKQQRKGNNLTGESNTYSLPIRG